MIDCTHRRLTTEPRLFVCSHPAVNAPNNVVWLGVCDGCPHADGGCQAIEPKRIGDERRGLGDAVADWIAAVGFKAKRCCGGCTKRKQLLNRWLPFRRAKVITLEDRR